MTAFNPTSLLALGGLTAIITAGWRYIRMTWDFLRSFVVASLCFNDSDVEMIVFNYLWKNYRRLCLTGSRSITITNENIKATGRREMVACESTAMMRWIFWINGRPLFWNKDVRQSDGAVRSGSVGWIRGTMDVSSLITRAMVDYRKRFEVSTKKEGTVNRFQVSTMHGNSAGGLGSAMAALMSDRTAGSGGLGGTLSSESPSPASQNSAPKAIEGCGMIHQVWLETAIFFDRGLEDFGRGEVLRAIEIMSLDDEARALVDECRHWLQSESWFRQRGVPWRRGILLYGGPGTGKTSLLRAIAEDLDLPVFVLDLGTMNNKELQQAWSRAVTLSPCMAVVEDIDGVFHGRENIMGEKGGGLSFDALLNTIDGLDRANGILFAITTNRIDLVDPALGRPVEGGRDSSTRPGRIDRVVCLKSPDEAGRRKIAQRILLDWPERIEEIVTAGALDTGAQFQDRCVRLAQNLFWAKKVQ